MPLQRCFVEGKWHIGTVMYGTCVLTLHLPLQRCFVEGKWHIGTVMYGTCVLTLHLRACIAMSTTTSNIVTRLGVIKVLNLR